MSFFNGGVNNSKLTPEFNRQGNAATDGNNDAKDNQVQEGTIDNVDNNPNVTEGNNNQPTQTNDNVYAYDENEVFNSPEEIMEALREARNLASQRENDFKNLQRDYTKKSQRLAFLDKMGNRNLNKILFLLGIAMMLCGFLLFIFSLQPILSHTRETEIRISEYIIPVLSLFVSIVGFICIKVYRKKF